jgi:hypothetical protein
MSKSSQLNLYDEQTLTTQFAIKASGSSLILPDNTVVDGVKLTDKTKAIYALNDVLQELTGKLIPTSEKSYAYDSPEAVAISADQGQPIANPNDVGLGWYFTNSGTSKPTNKINWYFVGGDVKRLLGDLFAITARVKIYNNTSLQDLPYITIYTKPQGAGDASSWYRSRQNWLVSSGDQSLISAGDTVLLVNGSDPTDEDKDIAHYVLEKDDNTSVGPQNNDEQILLISFSTDSGATLNSVQFALTKFTSSYNGNTSVIHTTS